MDDATIDHVIAQLRQLVPDLHGPRGQEIAREAEAAAAREALAAIDHTAEAPERILALAIGATYASPSDPTVTWQIHAIQPATDRRIVPDRPILDASERNQWHFRRLGRNLRPSDPRPVVEECPGWALRITGNPVALAGWLQDRGIDAGAWGPTTVVIRTPTV